MSNRPKEKRATDESIAEADRLYKAARADADEEIKKLKEKLSLSPWIFEMAGKIKGLIFTEAQATFLKLLFLKKVKDAKEYREVYGMIWEDFCKYVGVDRRRTDEMLMDLKPFGAAFLAEFASFSGYDLSKIKYLGMAKLAESASFTDNSIIYQGEEIPLTPEHRDDIQALFEKLEETYKKQIEEKTSLLRTKDRLLESKDQLIHRQEKTLSKYERNAGEKGLTLEEDAFLQKVENLRIGFDGYMLSLDPERVEEIRRENNPSPRMVSAYIAALEYMKMQICAARDMAVDLYADPAMMPDEGWQPPPEAAVPKDEPVLTRPRPSTGEPTLPRS